MLLVSCHFSGCVVLALIRADVGQPHSNTQTQTHGSDHYHFINIDIKDLAVSLPPTISLSRAPLCLSLSLSLCVYRNENTCCGHKQRNWYTMKNSASLKRRTFSRGFSYVLPKKSWKIECVSTFIFFLSRQSTRKW